LTVVTTYLGLHALPADYAGRQDEYVDRVCFEDLPALAHEGLVDAVDAFCEGIAFTPRQVDRFFRAARTLGLPVKLHAEQLSNLGGAELAASHGALSADHLEYLDRHGSEAMARAGTVAVLLPGAFYTLRERQVPPIALLRDAGVRMAVATDANPGSSPLLSLLTAGNMACVLFGLTPAEAFLGMTAIAAEALGLRDRGRLRVGMRADCCVWRVDQPAALVYEIATHRPWRIVVAGRPVDNAARSL
jgi:imidazolonepropionase